MGSRCRYFKWALQRLFFFLFILLSVFPHLSQGSSSYDSPPPQLPQSKMRTCISWKALSPHQPSSDSMKAAPTHHHPPPHHHLALFSSAGLLSGWISEATDALHRLWKAIQSDHVLSLTGNVKGIAMNVLSAWLTSRPLRALPFSPKLPMTSPELRWEKAANVLHQGFVLQNMEFQSFHANAANID